MCGKSCCPVWNLRTVTRRHDRFLQFGHSVTVPLSLPVYSARSGQVCVDIPYRRFFFVPEFFTGAFSVEIFLPMYHF